MGIEDGKYQNRGRKCDIKEADLVVFEAVFGTTVRIRTTLGYATFVDAK